MNYIDYHNKTLTIEQVEINHIAKKISTPFYCYSANHIIEQFNAFVKYQKTLDLLVCYALKANANLSILKILAEQGAGADCVSAGEIKKALQAGISPDKIVFSGVGKSKKELEFAINAKILQFNVESLEELILINELALTKATKPQISLRINPDIDANTNSMITTGLKNNKFGIANEEFFSIYQLASTLSNIKIVGVSIHIGSQITKLKPFIQSFDFIIEKITELRKLGYNVSYIDLGGGLSVNYHDEKPIISIDNYMQLLVDKFSDLNCRIIIEPGRAIVAKSAILVSSILYNKKTPSNHFLIIDAGMNNLIRPSLYKAIHRVIPVNQDLARSSHLVDIVGPICESSDIFAKNQLLQQLSRDELVAILDVGAYGSSMSSNYNLRPKANEVLVKNNDYFVINE